MFASNFSLFHLRKKCWTLYNTANKKNVKKNQETLPLIQDQAGLFLTTLKGFFSPSRLWPESATIDPTLAPVEAFFQDVSFELGVGAGRKNPTRVDPNQNDGSNILYVIKFVHFLT